MAGPDFAAYQQIDDRLDALERRAGAAESALEGMKKPFYRRKGFWGSLTGMLILAGGWLWSSIADDPEIPRLVHSNILMSDKALALTLKRDLSDGETASPLFQQIGAQLEYQIKAEGGARDFLIQVAADQSVRTYSGSQTYALQRIPIGSVRCHILADEELWGIIRAAGGRGPSELDAFQRSCRERRFSGEPILVPFADFSPMIVPFVAAEGDDVRLDIHIQAQSFDSSGNQIEITNAHEFVEGTLFPQTGLVFGPPVEKNRLTLDLEILGDDPIRLVALNLTQDGVQKVLGRTSDAQARGTEYRIDLIAAITVQPKPAP